MRENFNKSLDKLHDEIILMGKLVSEAIEGAVKALVDKDEALAQKVYEGDSAVNKKEAEIEAMALNLLLTEQPVASDFRFVTTTLKMITDLERIGDQAADISYLNLKLSHRSYKKEDLGSIIYMAEVVVEMLELALTAYIAGDVEMTREVLRKDDIVDEYFRKVRREVVEDVKEDRFTAKNSLDILLIAKYLERIGDHTENIAERVLYSLKG